MEAPSPTSPSTNSGPGDEPPPDDPVPAEEEKDEAEAEAGTVEEAAKEPTATRITGLRTSMFKATALPPGAAVVATFRQAAHNSSAAWRLGTRLLELYLRLALERGGGHLPPNLAFRRLIGYCVTEFSSVAIPHRGPPFLFFDEAVAVWRGLSAGANQTFALRNLTQCIKYDTLAYVQTLLKNYTNAGLHAHCCAFIRFFIPDDKVLVKRAIALLSANLPKPKVQKADIPVPVAAAAGGAGRGAGDNAAPTASRPSKRRKTADAASTPAKPPPQSSEAAQACQGNLGNLGSSGQGQTVPARYPRCHHLVPRHQIPVAWCEVGRKGGCGHRVALAHEPLP